MQAASPDRMSVKDTMTAIEFVTWQGVIAMNGCQEQKRRYSRTPRPNQSVHVGPRAKKSGTMRGACP